MESRIQCTETGIDQEELYQQAVEEHPEYLKFPQNEIKQLISEILDETARLERVGEREKTRIEVPDDVLINIAVVWIISGPGTYDSSTKDDKYKDFVWSRGMDRTRLNHGAILARIIAEAKSGQHFTGSIVDIVQRKKQIKQMVTDYGPELIYNGTQLENDTVVDVLSRSDTVIPREKVHIIRGDIKTTLDQVKTFKLPIELKDGEELAIVSHAPHLVRIMHMINKYRPFPEGTKVRLFPVPTPHDGKNEYVRMETLGLLRYIYLDHEATREVYPYFVTSDIN